MSTIETCVALGTQMQEIEEEIDQLERDLKAKKAAFDAVSLEALPEAMEQAGVEEFTLSNGRKIGIKTKLFVSVSKANMGSFLNFVRRQGSGDLIKSTLTIAFGKDEEEKRLAIFQDLTSRGDLVDNDIKSEEGIHHSTLRAYVKRGLEEGVEFPEECKIHEERRAFIGS